MKNPFLLILLFSLSFVSCNQSNQNTKANKKTISQKYRDRLKGREIDTLYSRKWMKINFRKNIGEEVELYISEYNDTIWNQYKPYIGNTIDSMKAEFYDLKIIETKNPNKYKGIITIHSKYDK